MPKLVGFGKYSQEGAKGVLEKGFTSRKDVLATTAKSLGGTQDGYWVVSEARWDFMFLWDVPEQAIVAAQNLFLVTTASGGFDRAESYWLLDPEAVDGARSSAPTGYVPPNP